LLLEQNVGGTTSTIHLKWRFGFGEKDFVAAVADVRIYVMKSAQ
jgi:hypothetical protein